MNWTTGAYVRRQFQFDASSISIDDSATVDCSSSQPYKPAFIGIIDMYHVGVTRHLLQNLFKRSQNCCGSLPALVYTMVPEVFAVSLCLQ